MSDLAILYAVFALLVLCIVGLILLGIRDILSIDEPCGNYGLCKMKDGCSDRDCPGHPCNK